MSGFNWVDFILIVFLLVGMAVGYAQGLVRQLIGLFALYVALVLATQFFRALSQLAAQILKMQPNTLTNALAFFAILIFVMAVVNLLALDAYKSTRIRLLPMIDHLGGMLLGVASMWIIASIIVSVLYFSVNTQIWAHAEFPQQVIKAGLDTSQLASVTESTLPMIVSTIRVWMPNGLPALFDI
ncbi:MAG TPA: CvpA family protein [Anaerolineae bacterium]|nr:CvpA family protein [Anaerolineae bacterium]